MGKYVCILLLLFFFTNAGAQCEYKNTAFKSGEVLTYNLYFNWQFIWITVGTATMEVEDATYKGKKVYKGSLITRGNKRADKYFVMRDTLLCYTTHELVPMYFRKGALEGKRYTVDQVWYTYNDGLPTLRQHYRNKDGEVRKKTYKSDECVYAMMKLFLRARSFNPKGWK